jgi:glycine cleavage system transcriptional repressor
MVSIEKKTRGRSLMQSNIVFTLTGTDRIGIVEEVTKLLLDLGGNVETGRMARLGGEFAILMLVSVPSKGLDKLDKVVNDLTARRFKVTAVKTERTYAETHPGWLPRQIEVRGADHEGIIHQVARYLSQRGISIESMDTETVRAPISGTPLFTMTALVIVPPSLQGQDWITNLDGVGKSLKVDIKVSAAKEQQSLQ